MVVDLAETCLAPFAVKSLGVGKVGFSAEEAVKCGLVETLRSRDYLFLAFRAFIMSFLLLDLDFHLLHQDVSPFRTRQTNL